MFGPFINAFLGDLITAAKQQFDCHLHFVTAREMVNIMLAACDGREGRPSDYVDYRLHPITRGRTA